MSDKQRQDKPLVWLDPGHGGHDPGVCTPSGVRESVEALELALTLKESLLEEGMAVGFSRTGDTYPPLRQRTREAREAGAVVFVSLHFDIAIPGWRWGAYHDDRPGSVALANEISKALDPINGTMGVWTRSHTTSRHGRLYIADFRAGPAVMVEFGPVRDVQKAERIKLAQAVAPVIAQVARAEQLKRAA